MYTCPQPLDKGRQQACWPHVHIQVYLKETSSPKPRKLSMPVALSRYNQVARSIHYLFSSGSDPHSTLLGFCSIHFSSIQDALQHAKRLGWAHCPPPTPKGHPPPATQALGHSTHGTRLSTQPFTPCPAPQGVRAGGGRGQGVAGGRARGKLGW